MNRVVLIFVEDKPSEYGCERCVINGRGCACNLGAPGAVERRAAFREDGREGALGIEDAAA